MRIKINDDIYTVYDMMVEENISPIYNTKTKEVDKVGVGWRLVVTLVGGRRKTFLESKDRQKLVRIVNRIWESRKSRHIITKEDLNNEPESEDTHPECSNECDKTGGAIR